MIDRPWKLELFLFLFYYTKKLSRKALGKEEELEIKNPRRIILG